MKPNKFEYVWLVQVRYAHGWEDLTCGTYREMRDNLKEYRANDPAHYRMIQRRLINPLYTAEQVANP